MNEQCCNKICSNCFMKFEPQQFSPYYDKDPNSFLKRRKLNEKTPKINYLSSDCFPKTVLHYEKYDLRKI